MVSMLHLRYGWLVLALQALTWSVRRGTGAGGSRNNQTAGATIQDVHAIFFHNPYAKKPNILPQRVPSYDELRQRAQSQHVAMTEHHYARGHVVLDDEDDSSMDLDKQPGPHHFNARGPSLDQESPSPSPAHESLDPSHGGNDLIDDQALQMD